MQDPVKNLPGAAFLFYQRMKNFSVIPVQAGVVKAIVESVPA